MEIKQFFIYLAIMAGSTYLIRAVPFAVIREKTGNRTVRSFLTYIPYAVLAAMTIPAVFYAPASVPAAALGVIAAILVSLKNSGLLTAAVVSCAVVFAAEKLIGLIF